MSSAEPSNIKYTIRDTLDEEWQESYSERSVDVPKPEIIVEGQKDRKSVTLSQNDVVFVMDGGRPLIDPASVGHRDERIEVEVDVQVHTTEGNVRFDGAAKDKEYGGLVGEIKRIRDKFRNVGVGGFDKWKVQTIDDQVGSYGANRWVAVWNFKLEAYASPIDQDALRP